MKEHTLSPFKIAMQSTQKSILKYAKHGAPYGMMEAINAASLINLTITPEHFERRNHNIYATVKFSNNNESHTNEILIGKITASPIYQLYRDDIRYIDNGYKFSEHAVAAINAALPPIRRKLVENICSEICNKCEKTGIVLPPAQLSNGMSNTQGLDLAKHYCISVGGIYYPVIVGGRPVAIWAKEDRRIHQDALVNNSFGTESENLIALNAQAFKFIPYNRNANIMANDLSDYESIDRIYFNGSSDYIDGIMADPLTGLLWNLGVRYDKKLMRWTFQWVLEWEIFQIPGQTIGYQFSIANKFNPDAQ